MLDSSLIKRTNLVGESCRQNKPCKIQITKLLYLLGHQIEGQALETI